MAIFGSSVIGLHISQQRIKQETAANKCGKHNVGLLLN